MEAGNVPLKTEPGDSMPLHRRLLSRLPQRSSQGERVAVIVAVGGMVAGIFALGFGVDDPGESVAVLFTLPIVLSAVKFGAWGGMGTAALALALLGVWDLAGQDHMPVLSYFGRSAAYLLLGGLLGSFSTRLRATHERVRRREQQLDAILDNSVDRPGQHRLRHVVLILAHPNGFGVDLDQFGEWVLQPPGDRHRTTDRHIQVR